MGSIGKKVGGGKTGGSEIAMAKVARVRRVARAEGNVTRIARGVIMYTTWALDNESRASENTRRKGTLANTQKYH